MTYLPSDYQISPAKKRMVDDARFVAAHIVRDMGAAFCKKGDFWTQYLGARFGDYSYSDLKSCGANGIFYPDTQSILVDFRLPEQQEARTVRHEIAHKLAMSGRYEYMELPRYARYNYREFHEMIAEIVVLAFEITEYHQWVLSLLTD